MLIFLELILVVYFIESSIFKIILIQHVINITLLMRYFTFLVSYLKSVCIFLFKIFFDDVHIVDQMGRIEG